MVNNLDRVDEAQMQRLLDKQDVIQAQRLIQMLLLS